MQTLKAQIAAALAANTATIHDNGKAVLFDGILYSVVKGASPYRRMPAQKENRKRLGIVLNAPTAPTNAAPAPVGVRVVIGPAAVRYGKRAAAADFIRYARKMGIIA